MAFLFINGDSFDSVKFSTQRAVSDRNLPDCFFRVMVVVCSMKYKPFFIVNPHSGSGSTAHLWREWQELIRERIGSADFSYTETTMHAAALTREALDSGHDPIVAVGGDGTLNEVLNGFFVERKALFPQAKLSYIPNGTGADFSRTIGFHDLSIEEHIERLLRAEVKYLDCGEVCFRDVTGRQTSRLFINESSLGFSATTADAVNRASKHFRGRLPFLIGVIRCLSTLKNPVLRISVDGESVHEKPTLLVAISNGKYFGGGMMIAPDAEIDDGLLDIVIIAEMSRLTLLRKIKSIYSGQHLREPEVTVLRGKSVHITAFEEQVLMEMDGEQPGSAAADYRISKTTIPFIC